MDEREKGYRKANKLFDKEEGRIEFVGKIASEDIRKQYRNSNVVAYLGKTQKEFKYITPKNS
jgi:hypothetical protein